jgi:ribosomal protein S18 acetylase RimI-like enzyme
MKSIKIRKAEKKDLRKIGKLMLREFSKAPFNERVKINAVLKSLNFYYKIGQIYVAMANNNIAGAIVFKKEQYWEGPVIIIEDLAVDERYKKQGIGKKLMNFAEDLGKSHNVKSILFKTNKESKAVKFYKKMNYKIEKSRINMRKRI